MYDLVMYRLVLKKAIQRFGDSTVHQFHYFQTICQNPTNPHFPLDNYPKNHYITASLLFLILKTARHENKTELPKRIQIITEFNFRYARVWGIIWLVLCSFLQKSKMYLHNAKF